MIYSKYVFFVNTYYYVCNLNITYSCILFYYNITLHHEMLYNNVKKCIIRLAVEYLLS